MKLISWNVNGLRAVHKKGFEDFFNKIDADIFCIQETKMQEGQIELNMSNYKIYMNSAVKKGYSGTAVFTKIEPINVNYGIGIEEHDQEGRVITLEFDEFFLVNVYTPNSQRDFNVAHNEIDLKNPKQNRKNAGFTDEERDKMTKLLEAGFIDTYRLLYPTKENAYTWWSYMANAREKNIGWRIDYFITSNKLKDKIKDAKIYSDIMGSDHCPVGLEIAI